MTTLLQQGRTPSHKQREADMAVARVTEIIAGSKKGFQDAIDKGIKRANKTLKGVSGVWVKDQTVLLDNGEVVEYRVVLKVTFVLK
jgi:flavin-binding protein dodecin